MQPITRSLPTDKEQLKDIGRTAVKIWEVLNQLPYALERHAELIHYLNLLESSVQKMASLNSSDALKNSKLTIKINSILRNIFTEINTSHHGILERQRTKETPLQEAPLKETPSERVRRSVGSIIRNQLPIDSELARYKNLLYSHQKGLQIYLDTLWANLIKPPA